MSVTQISHFKPLEVSNVAVINWCVFARNGMPEIIWNRLVLNSSRTVHLFMSVGHISKHGKKLVHSSSGC